MDSRTLDLFVKIALEVDEIEARMRDFQIDAARWSESRPMRDLILMPLIQIGELTTHFKDNEHLTLFPQLPWREIKGFRNVVVHGYGQIDPDVAWKTASEDILELRDSLLANPEVAEAYQSEMAHREGCEQGEVSAEDLRDFINDLPLAE